MKKFLLLFIFCGWASLSGKTQLLSWTTEFPLDTDNLSITVDATRGNRGLNNYSPVSDVYVHAGVITNLSATPTSWRYVKFNQNFNQPNPQLQASSLGNNKWKFDISNIRAYFGVPSNETILKVAILFRNGAGTAVQRNTDGSDMYVPVYDNTVAVRFTMPLFQPTFTPVPEPINKQVGDNIELTAISNGTADNMKLYLNGTVIQNVNSTASISANPVLSTSGNQVVVAEATRGGNTKTDTLRFFVASAPSVQPLPAGVRDGINYEQGNTSVVLVLYAPGKNRVSVIGEFPGSNWIEQSSYVMNKTPDGNYWWLRITGLTPGTEYAFQYLVDGVLKVGEPYAEKVLDPWNDGFISSTTYPSLKPYPTGKTTGIVSVLQTSAPAYNWAVSNFSRPDKRNLVVYELLLRDFLMAHDWKTLRDTLNYLVKLGVNAIELMPFNEFDGNESWGYNPSYFFAPDKYYGTKNALKEFIDSCHKKGIAVIMDMVLNHTTGSNPLAALYWNSSTNQPAANNPWLNVNATHPFNVFNDFNHESMATRYFSSRVIEHWLKEYKLDGYRFDLSKGFTQVNSGSNVGLWSQYDASRVAIWKRYYDTCQAKSPGSYVILEHFADNTEERELSNYGMLLWGNNTYNFQEAAMGYLQNSNFEGYLHTVRGWNSPHLVSYLESHDEERLMYKNLQFGNSNNAAHNVKDLNTSLKRMEMCAAFLLSAPGPKLIWQFGEMGYDQSINRCVNGTVNSNCRLDNKPILWNYLQNEQRKRVFDVYAAMNKLRFHPLYKDVFIANNTSIDHFLAGGVKWMRVRSFSDSSSLLVVGNFDVTTQTTSVVFPVAGTWYNYITGSAITATGVSQSITLEPGEYRVYINRNLSSPGGPVDPGPGEGTRLLATVAPNPLQAVSVLDLYLPQAVSVQYAVYNTAGQKLVSASLGTLAKGKHRISLTDKMYNLPPGIHLVNVIAGGESRLIKLLVQ